MVMHFFTIPRLLNGLITKCGVCFYLDESSEKNWIYFHRVTWGPHKHKPLDDAVKKKQRNSVDAIGKMPSAQHLERKKNHLPLCVVTSFFWGRGDLQKCTNSTLKDSTIYIPSRELQYLYWLFPSRPCWKVLKVQPS